MTIKTKRFINSRKNCSCSMPGVWRAVAYCEGAVVIFHSPKACAHIARSMDINAYYGTIADGRAEQLVAVPLLSSQLEDKHSIFGGMEQLEKCIKFAVQTYVPQCLIIANSCVAGVIGDDVAALAHLAEIEYAIPIITVDCYGFLDGEYYKGYFSITETLIAKFFQPQPQEKGTVILLGDNGGPWGHYATEVRRLLQALDIKVIGQFPGYVSISEMQMITKAEGAIVLGGRGQTHIGLKIIAEKLQKQFNIKYLPDIYPIGAKNTESWILGVGKLFGREEQATQLLCQEQAMLQGAMRQFLPTTQNKKTVLCIGRCLTYFDPEVVLEIIKKLQLQLSGIILLTASYDDKERQEMMVVLKSLTDATIYDVTDTTDLLQRTDLLLTTHELQHKNLKQIFLPLIIKAGTAGEIEFMQSIYRALCSKICCGGIVYV